MTSRFAQLALIVFLLLLAASVCARPVARIDGLNSDLANRVIDRTPADGVRCDSPRWVVRAWSRDLESEISRSLRARSHYAPTVRSRIEQVDDCWRVEIEVDRGEVTRLRRFDFDLRGEGVDDDAFARALEANRLELDAAFREDRYEALKRSLRRVALERGYLDSRFVVARVDVWPEEQAADVELVFDSGIRYRFGDNHFTVEPDRLGDAMLERFQLWEPGEPYATVEIERLRRRLLQAGYFDRVDVDALTEQRRDGKVDLDVALGLRPRHEVSGGVGFSTDYGPRLRAAYENRYLNRRGHQGSVRMNVSPVLQELYSDYRMPLRRGDDAWLVIDATLSREDTDSVDTLTQALGLRRIRSGPWGTRITESLTLKREDFDVASDDDVAWLAMPGFGISKTRQTRQRPLEIGWRLDGEVRGAAAPLATTNFLQLYARGALALPLGQRARAIGRVEFGTTYAESLRKLPASIRFFAGGDRSIRGYSLDSLGPTDAQDDVRGGRHLGVASLELEHLVTDTWSVAVFADTGSAFNKFSDPLSSGVGLGVRWQSPVGPIRLDLAHPLDDGGRKVRLHIGVGSTFQ